MRKLFVLFIAIVTFTACSEKESPVNYKMMAVLYIQNSPEAAALYHQGFNIAKQRVADYILENNSERKSAVIVDIDETMLDNSPESASEIITGIGYNSETWKAWTELADARALPGAVDFAKYAQGNGVEVFYISNRKTYALESTIKNLISEGFPFADETHVILRSAESSKKRRREAVQKDYDIICLIGDNLDDFSEVFEDRSINFGKNKVQEFKDKFGDRFIVMPNPMYGSWEKYIYDGDNTLPDKVKSKKRMEKLKPIK